MNKFIPLLGALAIAGGALAKQLTASSHHPQAASVTLASRPGTAAPKKFIGCNITLYGRPAGYNGSIKCGNNDGTCAKIACTASTSLYAFTVYGNGEDHDPTASFKASAEYEEVDTEEGTEYIVHNVEMQ